MKFTPGSPRDYGVWASARFFGDSGGQSGTQVVQQSNSPWSGQAPYLTKGFESASQLLDQPKEYFPNSTVVPFSDATMGAQQRLLDRSQGSPLDQANNQNLTATLNGDYLNSNPYLDQTFNKAAGAVRSQLDSQFNGAGRLGSGMSQAAAGDAYGNLANQVYGQNYANERTNQLRASALAPQAAQQDYTNIAAQGQVGQQQEQLAGQTLQDQINRFNFGQNEPSQRLRDYLAAVAGGSFGSNSTTATPLYSNTLGQNLGIGLGALYGANQLKGLFG